MTTVSRTGRLLDVAGLLLFLVGGGVFARAWIGFQGLRAYEAPPDAEAWAAIAQADGYSRLQTIGAAGMIIGIAIFVVAWWLERRVSS